MKRIIYIALLLLIALSASAKKKVVATASPEAVETEQELKYYFYEAMHCFDESRYDEAFALFRYCEMISPNDAAVCNYLSIMYGGLSMNKRSALYAEKAYQLSPSDYWQRWVNIGLQSNDPSIQKRAINALDNICKTEPDNTDALELRQRVYLHYGDYKNALKIQDKIDRAEGPTPYGAFQRYEIYDTMGKRKQAVAAINDYLEYEPDNTYFQIMKAELFVEEGNREAALQQYHYIQKNYPENEYLDLAMSDFYGKAGETDSAAHYQLQAISNENVDLSQKLKIVQDFTWLPTDSLRLIALEQLAVQYPQDESAIYPLSKYHSEHGNWKEAQSLLTTVIDINPTSETAWQSLLEAVQADSTVTDSAYAAIARKAMNAMPEKMQWYYIMSIAEIRQDRRDSAIYYCKEGLKKGDEKDFRYRMAISIQLGDLYAHQNEMDSAFAYYDAALRIDPDNVYVLNNYAYFLAINGGDLRKAEKMSQKTIKQEPHNATFLDTYAWILHLQGQDMLAKFYMQQAWNNMEDKSDEDLRAHYEVLIGPLPDEEQK